MKSGLKYAQQRQLRGLDTTVDSRRVQRAMFLQERDGELVWYKRRLRQRDQGPKSPAPVKVSRREHRH